MPPAAFRREPPSHPDPLSSVGLKHVYGNKPAVPNNVIVGLIATAHPTGPLAHAVFTPPDKIYLVPQELYTVSRDHKGRPKPSLVISDQVQFEVDERGVALWMEKVLPPYLLTSGSIECVYGEYTIESLAGIIETRGGKALWSPKNGIIDVVENEHLALLHQLEMRVLVWSAVKLIIDYGPRYTGASIINYNDPAFKPFCRFNFIGLVPDKPVQPEEVNDFKDDVEREFPDLVNPAAEEKPEYHHRPLVPYHQQQQQKKTEAPIRSPAGGEDPGAHIRKYDQSNIRSIIDKWLK